MKNIEKIKEYIDSELSKDRLIHTYGVSEFAKKLCKNNDIEEEKGEIAGLLHDCTKEKKLQEQLKLVEKYNIILEYPIENMESCLHADTGAALALNKFEIDDDIYNAIKFHTLARGNMSTLEKIIFIADKCEEGRDRYMPKAKEYRKLALNNLNLAMKTMMIDNISYLKSKNIEPFSGTKEALDSILKEVE